MSISFLGECFLAAMFLLCGLATVFGLVLLKLESRTAKKVFLWAGRAVFVAAGFSVVTLILLIVAFLTDDFSIAAVGQYSSKTLPFFYKLSAVWAGSAGSLLLWSVGVFVLFALWLSRSESGDIRFDAIALSVGSGVCLGFSALLVFVEKPFVSCLVTIDNGVGLNPLLQNFWMIIHPPLLFVGYSAFLVPLVIVSASVFAGRATDSHVYRQLRQWLLFGICFLALGIATGARWSYVELGWGGYWAWDPVENASLLPWLLAVVALHSLAGLRFSEKFRFWTIVLVPVPFILCLVATFITRSGVLQSVHSFSENIMSSALLVFIGCCLLLWLICIVRAAKSIPVSPPQLGRPILDITGLLFWANIIFVFMAIVIGVATFWPIVSRAITGSNSGVVLTRTFYDIVVSVAGVILAFLVGLSVLASLKKTNIGFTIQWLSCCAVGLISYSLVFKVFGTTFFIALACGVCAFSFVAVLMKLRLNLKAGGNVSGNIAHLGLLLLVVAAGFASAERVVQTRLARGGIITISEYEFVYDSFKHKLFSGVTKVGPEIVVRKKGLTKKLWPHNVLYPNGQSTAEVAVCTGLLEDIYVSFDGVTEDGKVTVTAKVKPLMLWLWFAFLLIVAGSAGAMLEGKRPGK